MIIECTECHTRFKLADDKVKPGGTKVRCSKCKHIFTVAPPPPPPQEEIDFGEFNMERLVEPGNEPAVAPPAEGVAANAAVREDATIKGSLPVDQAPYDDFAPGSEAGAGQPEEFIFGAAPDTQEKEAPAGQEPDEEFTFGDAQETAGADRFAFGNEIEVRPDKPANELGSEEEFPFDEESAEPDAFTFGQTTGTQLEDDDFDSEDSEEFAFGEEQDSGEGDAGPDEFSFAADGAAGSVEFDFDEDETGAETGVDFSWDADEEESGEETVNFDESNKPTLEVDEFDFSNLTFGEEESSPTGPTAGDERLAPVQPQPELLSIDEPPAPYLDKVKAATAPLSGPQPLPPSKSPRRKSPVQGVMYFLGLLLLVMTGGAVYFYWQGGIPELTAWVDRLTGQTASHQVTGQIRLEGLSSYYLTHPEVGQMLIIQGRAINAFPEARSSLAVKGVIFNKEGKALLQQTVFCGNPLDQEVLKKFPYAKIEESMNNPFGESLSNLNVAPGKALPFTIVFRNLPPDIAEFTVEAVDSKPGSKQ